MDAALDIPCCSGTVDEDDARAKPFGSHSVAAGPAQHEVDHTRDAIGPAVQGPADIKHELGDLPGIQGDVDAFMRKNGVPEEYREQLMNAAQDALKQQIAQQAGGVPPGAVPGDDNWADSHVEEEEDDSPEEEEEVEVE